MFSTFLHPKIINVSYNKFDSKPIPLPIKRNKLLGLEIREIIQLNSSSRAKFSCFHSNDDKEHPWIAVAFHSGEIKVFEYDGNTVFTIEDADPHIPKRCVKFIERLNSLIFGSDSFSIWIYNYVVKTLEKVTEGHLDYIRCLCVHPRLPYLISCADDQTIRLWNWENNWKLEEVFTGHEHYIMYICMHPDNPNIIASGSLDSTVRVWNFNMDEKYEAFSNNRHQKEYPYYQQNIRVLSPPKTNPLLTTLKGFQAGVDCVDFYKGSDPEKRNWLVASADDKTVRIFDWKRSQCVTVIPALHSNNVLSCLFEKDILFTGKLALIILTLHRRRRSCCERFECPFACLD